MALGVDLLNQRVNPRLVISISVILSLAVPAALLVEFIIFLVQVGGAQEKVLDTASAQIVSRLELAPLSKYQGAVEGKQLFKPPVEKPAPIVPQVGIQDLAKNLELTGIVELDQREAIIKDRRANQSYFVNEGSVIGELAVEKIESDHVVLSYKEEKFELHIV